MATVARERVRPSRAPGGSGGNALPGRSRRGRWPAGLIGALALILLLDGVVARLPVRPDYRSRLASSWDSAYRRRIGARGAGGGPVLRRQPDQAGCRPARAGSPPRPVRLQPGRAGGTAADRRFPAPSRPRSGPSTPRADRELLTAPAGAGPAREPGVVGRLPARGERLELACAPTPSWPPPCSFMASSASPSSREAFRAALGFGAPTPRRPPGWKRAGSPGSATGS